MTLLATLGRAGLRAACSTSCHAQSLPPCPAACRAQDPPACRARAQPPRRGTRVVCCAPPPGSPPPCPPPPPSCPLTCQNARAVCDQNCVPSNEACLAHSPEELYGYQDAVAQRLERARGVRRAHYAWTVAWRAAASPAPCPCPAPYALRGERQCARATDGCTYAVLREHSAPEPARCGPGRAPPPPRCVELAPDNACRMQSQAHVDPCAHRPRVVIDIDRSCSTPAPPSGAAPPCCRQPTSAELLGTQSLACQSNRYTHTSAALLKTATPVGGGIQDVLRSKEQLKEAGARRWAARWSCACRRARRACACAWRWRAPSQPPRPPRVLF
ncbi:hypothetical protein PYW07_000678 [Mythimna separata]|uniref:Uncharacterized protein n=1 Tax=Mythimna separata TaxID=271217 RepID=A0AAD8DW64_MYTSE|nr:hypothetical protein PYW07_000678 [Mythimna separata]